MFDVNYWLKRSLHAAYGRRFFPSLLYCLDCDHHVQPNHVEKEPNHLIRVLGARLRKQDPRDYDIRRLLRVEEEPPESFDCRDVGNVEPVRQQDSEGSCVGQAGCGVKGGMEKANETYPDGGISSRCCYNGAKWVGGYLDGEGAYSDDLMKFMLHYGPCRESLWPYRAGGESNVYPPPTQEARDDQTNWKIKNWWRINKTGIGRDEMIRLTKQAIAQRRHGIYLAVPWPNNWMYVIGEQLPPPSGSVAGGHAIHIIAYDLDGFTLRNSWGKGWAGQGDGWASWDSFEYFERNGWYDILDAEDEISPKPEPEKSCMEQLSDCLAAAKSFTDQIDCLVDGFWCVLEEWGFLTARTRGTVKFNKKKTQAAIGFSGLKKCKK